MAIDNARQYLILQYITNDLVARLVFVERNARETLFAIIFKKFLEGFGGRCGAHHCTRGHHILCLNGSEFQQVSNDFRLLFLKHPILCADISHCHKIAAAERAGYVFVFEFPGNQLAEPYQRSQKTNNELYTRSGNGC